MVLYVKCLHSDNDSAGSSSSTFFAESKKAKNCEARMDVYTSKVEKIVLDSALQKEQGSNSKHEATKS